MAGFIPRAILAFLWNLLSGVTPSRKKGRPRGVARGEADGGGRGHDGPRVVRPGPFTPRGPCMVGGRSVAKGEADKVGRGHDGPRVVRPGPYSRPGRKFLYSFFFLKGVAPESGFHRNAKIARCTRQDRGM